MKYGSMNLNVVYNLYEVESVNGSQTDMKRKACDIRTWEKRLFPGIYSTNIDTLIHWYTWPIALPVRRNSAAWKTFDCCLSHLQTSISNSLSSAKRFHPVVKRFTRQTLSNVKRTHFIINVPLTESFCPQKAHNRSLFFVTTLLKHGCHFDYWNQPLNRRMRVCYLECPEGDCCYLVIQIENLLRPLQLFYFHLWPIY
jgi:hypothetical protein